MRFPGFLGVVALVLAASACAPTFTPADGSVISDEQGKIDRCKNLGRDAGSFGAYDACMRDAGLR